MAATARRRGVSPSPLDSPSLAHSTARKDGNYFGIGKTSGLMDVASPLSASHTSLITEPAHATLLSRPRSPVGYRVGSASSTQEQYSQHPLQSQISSNEHTKDWAQSKTTINGQKAASSARHFSTKKAAVNRSTEKAFYRRLLFQDLPSSEDVPPISSDAELDHEIYLLLAYLLRETVLPWYSKLTPDKELLTQIATIVVSIIHAVAIRMSSREGNGDVRDIARVHAFLSTELPLVVYQHFVDYRTAQTKVGSIWAPLVSSVGSIRGPQTETLLAQEVEDALAAEANVPPAVLAQLFHAASPHPGINTVDGSLDGKAELAYLRIATLALLGSILPADDFMPETERFIVRDVLVTVLRGVIAKPSRPWFITQSIHKALDSVQWNEGSTQSNRADSSSSTSPSIGSIALVLARFPALMIRIWTIFVFTVLPILTRTYLDLFSVQTRSGHRRQRSTHRSGPKMTSSMSRSWSVGSLSEKRMHGRFPSEVYADFPLSKPEQSESHEEEQDPPSVQHSDPPAAYVVTWIMLLEETMEIRSSSLLTALFGFVKVGLGTLGLDHHMDRVITATINRKANDLSSMSELLKKAREALLPGGHLPPPVADPDESMQCREWARLRARLIYGMPPLFRKILLGHDFTAQFETVTRWLAPLCAPQAAGPNTLLGIMAFERILVMLCPDMVDSYSV